MVCRASLVVGATTVLAATGMLGASAPAAHADEEIVELHYAAPAACPTREIVEAEIRERTPNVRIAQPARRVFAITISATPSGFRGTLEVGSVADRELAADRCDDLATALALVTALAIDPTATARPRPPPPPPRTWSAEADAGAMLEGGVGPSAMFAAVVEARAAWSPGFQLELAVIAGRDTADDDGGQARFTWLAARPGACRRWPARDPSVAPSTALSTAPSTALSIGVCGHVEIGAVRAAGDMIVNQRDLTRLWLAAGGHGDADYALGGRMFAQLQLGASVPLVRDRYLFAPNVAIHDTPTVTGWLVVGLGVRFP